MEGAIQRVEEVGIRRVVLTMKITVQEILRVGMVVAMWIVVAGLVGPVAVDPAPAALVWPLSLSY